jgi:hypothetical protein
LDRYYHDAEEPRISTFGVGEVCELQEQNLRVAKLAIFPLIVGTSATFVLIGATIDRQLHLMMWVRNSMQKLTSMTKRSAIPLDHAVLCLDCNCVSDANRECPACSSRALMNLSVVLDRREEIEYTRELAVA